MEGGGGEAVTVSKQEMEKLVEQMKQFEVDTEFVWSLWKEAQKDSPDMLSIITRVQTKEKEKHAAERKKLLHKLKEKEKAIASLEQANARKETATDELLSGRISELEVELAEKATLLSDTMRTLSTQKATLSDRNKEINLLKLEVSSSVEKSAGLKEKLFTAERELRGSNLKCAAQAQELAKLKDELYTVVESREKKLDVNVTQAANIKILVEQNQQFRREIASLKEKGKSPVRKEVPAYLKRVASPKTPDSPTPVAVQETARLKRKIADLKLLLKAKNDELKNLQAVHGRRLERMRVLRSGYELALEQIKTYESKGSPRVKLSPCPVHSTTLQHEDSEGVWNELAHYKEDCKAMKKKFVLLEEERDCLATQCLQNQAEITKLKTIERISKQDIESKIAAIAAAEAGGTDNIGQTKQIHDLIKFVEQLKVENQAVKQECTSHASECKALHAKLHLVQQKLRASQKIQRAYHSSTSTMTDEPHSTTEIGINTSLSFNKQRFLFLDEYEAFASARSSFTPFEKTSPSSQQSPRGQSYSSVGASLKAQSVTSSLTLLPCAPSDVYITPSSSPSKFSSPMEAPSSSKSSVSLEKFESCVRVHASSPTKQFVSTREVGTMTDTVDVGTQTSTNKRVGSKSRGHGVHSKAYPVKTHTRDVSHRRSLSDGDAILGQKSYTVISRTATGQYLTTEQSCASMGQYVSAQQSRASMGQYLSAQQSLTSPGQYVTAQQSRDSVGKYESAQQSLTSPGQYVSAQQSRASVGKYVSAQQSLTSPGQYVSAQQSLASTGQYITAQPSLASEVEHSSISKQSTSGKPQNTRAVRGARNPSSPSSDGSVKPQGIGTRHRCRWQQEVGTLQQRLRSLRKQVMVLTTAKQMLTHRIDEESSLRCRAEADLKDMTTKCRGAKKTIESIKNDKMKLSQEVKDLQEAIAQQKGANKTDADWRRMESQHKDLLAKCSSLSSMVKSLEGTVATKSSELTSANERCSKLERDVKQKRALIEDYRRKQAEFNGILADKEEKISQFSSDVQSWTEIAEQEKQKAKSINLQLVKVRKEKNSVEEDLKLTLSKMSKLNAIHLRDLKEKTRLEQRKNSLEADAQTQQMVCQDELMSIQEEVQRLQGTVLEFKTFVMELADLLTKTFQQEYLKRKETEFVHNPETDALAGRVREIARTALSMSDMELQEFFEDEASVDHVLSEAQFKLHKSFRDLIMVKLSSELEGHFAEPLLKAFSDYVSSNFLDEENTPSTTIAS